MVSVTNRKYWDEFWKIHVNPCNTMEIHVNLRKPEKHVSTISTKFGIEYSRVLRVCH